MGSRAPRRDGGSRTGSHGRARLCKDGGVGAVCGRCGEVESLRGDEACRVPVAQHMPHASHHVPQ
eukprot:3747070-Prymnesium_polylepis.1